MVGVTHAERLVYLNEAFQVQLVARFHVSHVLRA